jgi:hypothetical protein
MSDGFPNKPRILRGAFVEFGLSLPPLVVVFQFNPLQVTRNRSLTYSFPGASKAEGATPERTLRQFHRKFQSNLLALQKQQLVTVQEQVIWTPPTSSTMATPSASSSASRRSSPRWS